MSYNSEVLADSPVAYWKLGETSGSTAADSSGNGHDATYHSVTLNQTGMISGESDKATLFDGSSSYVDCGNPAALQLSGVGAVEMILKGTWPTTGSFTQFVISGKGFDGSVQAVQRVFINPPDAPTIGLNFENYSGGDHAVGFDVTWPSGQAHHVVWQYTGTKLQIVIDGSLAAEATDGVGFVNTSKNFVIGAEDQGSIVNFFKGTLEKIAVYSSSLSLGRILAHAIAGGFASGVPTITAASVPTTGRTVALTLSGTATLAATDFQVATNGVDVPVRAITGAGTSWVLHCDPASIVGSETVKVSYVGDTLALATLSATNASTVTARVRQFLRLGFGTFFHWSADTFSFAAATQAAANTAFNPVDLDMDQWIAQAVAMKAKYVILTTKHDGGFCLWATETTWPNSSATPWGVSTGIDVVALFCQKAHAAGLWVGLYYNTYDPYYTGQRPGHDGTYSGYTSAVVAHLTELLSNYGQIDILWIDSWEYVGAIGYTNLDYATIRALITSLQPKCILINNTHTLVPGHSDVVEMEDSVSTPPSSSNLYPAEFSKTPTADGDWIWNSTNNGACLAPLVVAQILAKCKAGGANYITNIAPNNLGLVPSLTVTFCAALGALVGLQGGPSLALPAIVASGEDRGDGVLGSAATGGGGGGSGGIYGSPIFGTS